MRDSLERAIASQNILWSAFAEKHSLVPFPICNCLPRPPINLFLCFEADEGFGFRASMLEVWGKASGGVSERRDG